MGNRLVSFAKPFILRKQAKTCGSKLWFSFPERMNQYSKKSFALEKFCQMNLRKKHLLELIKSRRQRPVTFHMSKVGSGPNKSSSGATSTVGSLDSISVQTCKMFFLFTLSRSFLETLGHFSFKYFFTAPTVGNFLATFKNGFPEESLITCKTAVICS